MIDNLPITQWAEDDRPREKMQLKGRHNLSDAELIAILIGSGTKSKSAVEVAKEMLFHFENNLVAFSKATLQELMHFKGIGDAKAITIAAALELGRRRKESTSKSSPKINSSALAFNILRPFFEDLQHEEFHILLLNRANKVIQVKRISIGGLSGTVADGKVIFRDALLQNASGIILAHNHPSGQLIPSEADKSLTRKLVEYGKLIDLIILDHLIVGENNYFSFADEGILNA